MISVVLPLYNKEAYISRTIDSILNQTFRDFELVIINDGSTDRSVEIIASIPDERIRIIHQKNQGVSAARNRGYTEARFDYIAFIDGDDEWTPDHLQIIVYLIRKYPACGLYATSYSIQKESGEIIHPQISGRFPFDGTDGILDNFYELACGMNSPIHIASYAVKKTVITLTDGFPVGIKSGEDIMAITKLYAIADLAYYRKETAIYNLITSGKNERPFLKRNPMDAYFDSLVTTAAHRKGVRKYVSSWHKRQMVNAILSKHFTTALRQFSVALYYYPFHKKLYTAFLSAVLSLLTGKDLYALHKYGKPKNRV